ncbi:MAG: sugar phosphate isomerase/epimerase [Candidatus Hydrogenedentes bacterium]|nr:sugar phosphate isomerase/epimerase [Candidatus Hydrogenedentota bacterium]
MQLIMHSYTFRSYSLREAFVNAKRFGWDGIELQPCHFDSGKLDVELPAAVELGREYGVAIRCVDSGGDFINDDSRVVEKEVARMERDIEACARCGVVLINGGVGRLAVDTTDYGKNGSALAKDVHYERAANAMKHLGALAAKSGITIVFEIHMNMLTDTINSTSRLLDLIGLDNVRANPDCGNMYATSTAEKDPEELERLRGRIGYYHFKNCRADRGAYDFSVRLADGHIDVYKWLEKIAGMGYDGPMCVEYCGAGDPRVAAEADLAYMRRSLEWIRAAG